MRTCLLPAARRILCQLWRTFDFGQNSTSSTSPAGRSRHWPKIELAESRNTNFGVGVGQCALSVFFLCFVCACLGVSCVCVGFLRCVGAGFTVISPVWGSLDRSSGGPPPSTQTPPPPPLHLHLLPPPVPRLTTPSQHTKHTRAALLSPT